MAKDVTKAVWVFDTANDAEGIANKDETTTPVFDNVPLYIDHIRVDTGDGGNFLLNESDGGDEIVKLDGTPANDSIPVRIGRYVRGVFLQTVQTNMTVAIHHGVPTDD